MKNYRKFFCDIKGKTALFFWENYPSPRCLQGVTAEELAEALRKVSRNTCSTKKAQEIHQTVNQGIRPSMHITAGSYKKENENRKPLYVFKEES